MKYASTVTHVRARNAQVNFGLRISCMNDINLAPPDKCMKCQNQCSRASYIGNSTFRPVLNMWLGVPSGNRITPRQIHCHWLL